MSIDSSPGMTMDDLFRVDSFQAERNWPSAYRDASGREIDTTVNLGALACLWRDHKWRPTSPARTVWQCRTCNRIKSRP